MSSAENIAENFAENFAKAVAKHMPEEEWKIPRFKRLLTVLDEYRFQYRNWIAAMREKHGLTAMAECCPWNDKHTNKGDAGFFAVNADGVDPWNASCNHKCGKDLKRGARPSKEPRPKTDNTEQDRAKYLHGQLLMWDELDSVFDHCDEGAREAWNGNAPTKKSGAIMLKAKTFSFGDIEPEPIEWLWPGILPYGELCGLAGPAGVGKSMFALHILARAADGKPFAPRDPGGRKPIECVLISAEDDTKRATGPRLLALNTNIANIKGVNGFEVLDKKTGEAGERVFELREAYALLSAVLTEYPKARLVVIDPVNSYWGNTNTHVNAEMRAALEPIAKLARERNVCVLLVAHHKKGAIGDNAVTDQVGGSNAFVERVRALLQVAPENRDEPETGGRVVQLTKANYAKTGERWRYTVEVGDVTTPKGATFKDVARVVIDTVTPPSIAQLMRGQDDEASELDRAKDLLRGMLGARGGEVDRTVIIARADALGISVRTLYRAAGDKRRGGLGVIMRQDGQGEEHKSFWSLPPTHAEVRKRQEVSEAAFSAHLAEAREKLAEAPAPFVVRQRPNGPTEPTVPNIGSTGPTGPALN